MNKLHALLLNQGAFECRDILIVVVDFRTCFLTTGFLLSLYALFVNIRTGYGIELLSATVRWLRICLS